MFKITDGKGFHITFENGWTVSVQFGYVSYCDNYGSEELGLAFMARETQPVIESKTAEIAAWDINKKWHRFEENEDVVLGYQTPKEVLEFINLIANKEASVFQANGTTNLDLA